MKVDYVVVGGGITGACTAYHLAADGRETLLIERGSELAPTNPVSSSGDATKCFRSMYGSDRNMTRLCQASLDWWQRFQDESGSALFTPCGLLAFGADQQGSLAHWRDPRAARFVEESAPVLEREGVPHEILSRAEVMDRFPELRPTPICDHALLDKSAGILDATKAVRAIGNLAERSGAHVWTGVTVEGLVRTGATVTHLHTTRGDVRVKKSLILAAGYMNPLFAPESRAKIRVSKQQVAYFRPADPDRFGPGQIPIVIDLDSWRYVVPVKDGVVKVADDDNHLAANFLDPSTTSDYRADERFEIDARSFLRDFVPGLAAAQACGGKACLYTNTASEEYLIYRIGNRVVVSACSGHGFKNGPMTGLIAARLARGDACAWYFDEFHYENAAVFTRQQGDSLNELNERSDSALP